jgi:Tfp pilus assembly protein PilF
MQIIHPLNEFIYSIFPQVDEGDTAGLKQALEQFYTLKGFTPEVSIDGDYVTITLAQYQQPPVKPEYEKAMQFCMAGDYAKAKPMLEKLIAEDPTKSEYYRIMGQMLSDEGDQDTAIDYLIDALRWNPENGWALLMMGNIFAKFKDDLPTAMTYYEQALAANPDDYITMTNIGAKLMEAGQQKEAQRYFEAALSVDDTYPNTHYALALMYKQQGNLLHAFEGFIKVLRLAKDDDGMHQNALQQAVDIAQAYLNERQALHLPSEYAKTLEDRGAAAIQLEENKDITTAAKIEFAERYGRDYHLVQYNPKYPAYPHLIMHELTHLEFVLDAREAGANKVFYATADHRAAYDKKLKTWRKNMRKQGLEEESMTEFTRQMFEGLNGQIFNTPVDLFIEQQLYNRYPELRPYQFLSFYQLVKESIEAVTREDIKRYTPRETLSASKTYNMVLALQFREMYGIDLLNEFQASKNEQAVAQSLYEEYLDYKDDKEPAEEYELIQHWGEDLKLDAYFDLRQEPTASAAEDLLSSIEQDPYSMETDDPQREKQMRDFLEAQGKGDLNMAVVMYMVEALNYFKAMPKEDIKKIAFEIAMLGRQGFDPKKDGYRISTIKGKTFSGYHILAYYYVSWALAIPEMLGKLQLPYDGEYEAAKEMLESQ